jgi:hypothetical protein
MEENILTQASSSHDVSMLNSIVPCVFVKNDEIIMSIQLACSTSIPEPVKQVNKRL